MDHHDRNVAAPSLSDACQLLSNRYRREVLSYLRTKETDVAELDELVEYLDEETDEATASGQVRLSLLHKHIPKLAESGVIEYDHRSADVRYRDGTNLEALLAVVPRDGRSA